MSRSDPADLAELLAEAQRTREQLVRLTTRLEAFTDRLEDDLKRQEGGDDDGSAADR